MLAVFFFLCLAMAACRALTDYATAALPCSQRGLFLVQSRRLVAVRGTHGSYTHGRGIFGVFLDDPGPIKLLLSPARYTTSTGGVEGSLRLKSVGGD